MRLTSTLLADAISFAKSDPNMAANLQKRDNDDALYMAGIYCEMKTYTETPDKFYLRIIFDYAEFDNPGSKAPDIFVDLQTLAGGGFQILPNPATFAPDSLVDSTFK